MIVDARVMCSTVTCTVSMMSTFFQRVSIDCQTIFAYLMSNFNQSSYILTICTPFKSHASLLNVVSAREHGGKVCELCASF